MADQLDTEDTSTTEPEVTYSLFFSLMQTEDVEIEGAGDLAVRAIEQFNGVLAELVDEGVAVRGCYDLTGFDEMGLLLVWLRSASLTNLQWARRQLMRTDMFDGLRIFYSQVVVELTEIEPEPGRWINVLEVIEPELDAVDEAFSDDDLDVLADFESEAADDEVLSEAELDQAELDAADPELALEADATLLRGDAVVSLHSVLGIGQMRFVVVAEAEAPVALLGELGAPFGDDLDIEVIDSRWFGRYITPAEVFEVLH